MKTKSIRNVTKEAVPLEIDALYCKLLNVFYQKEDRSHAQKLAALLETAMEASPDESDSIRGEGIRALIAEVRGDYAEAARSREAEVRKILELHSLAANTPNWRYISRQYDFSDVSDRLDLLATLYDSQGELDRAIATLLESKRYCESHQIPFDGQDLLDEMEKAAQTGTSSVPYSRGARTNGHAWSFFPCPLVGRNTIIET